MIKYLLILFNVAGLLFFSSLFETEPVTVSHNFPESVSTGGEYVVEIKIIKNAVTGFAEFKQLLPDGFVATALDSKKGSFSFTDREVKIIWMSLPDENEFTVKYKISILSYASEGWVDGNFSYLENNQKSTVNLEKKKVLVNTTITNLDNPVSQSTQKNDKATTVDSALNLPVRCTRNLNYGTKANQILVEVSINNDSVSGFAKLEELIPTGYVASANELHSAVFSFVDQKVKFLWMSFPFEKEFKVSYYLTPSEFADDSTSINGYLSFTIAEESKKFTLTASPILRSALKSETAVSATPKPNQESKLDSAVKITSLSSLSTDENKNQVSPIATKEEVKPTNQTQTNSETTKPEEEKAKSTSPLGMAKAVTSIPDVQTGISFRVQICATHKPVEPSYFNENFKMKEEIFAEMHEGWHKFTVNNVNAYKQARDKREELKQNEMIKGPFVTAYNGGTRITVQEALMIANQKWVR